MFEILDLSDLNKSFKIAKKISSNEDMDSLILVLENWKYVNENLRPVFIDLIESFGFYTYLKDKNELLNTAALVRCEYHKSKFINDFENNRVVFHYWQKVLEEKISNRNKNL